MATPPPGLRKIHKAAAEIWEKLKNQPEKGYVGLINPDTDPPIYDPTKGEFIGVVEGEWGAWKVLPENEGKNWTSFVSYIRKKYGVGPTISRSSPTTIQTKDSVDWWRKKITHLSPDEKYYVVPLIYEKAFDNPALTPFVAPDGKLKISQGIFKEGNSDLAKYTQETFLPSTKKVALQKLAFDLSKALSFEDKEENAVKYGFFPKDSMVKKGKNDNNEWIMAPAAEAWHMEARNPDFQTLWLKVLFEKDWVDTLPEVTDPSLDFSKITREVMFLTKTLKEDLTILEKVLYHLDASIRDGMERSVTMSFDPLCSAGKTEKIYETLNDFLILNKVGDLKDLKETNGAVQLGFSENMKLQYVAYSEMPDCLCDQETLNSYTLKKGIGELKATPPFDSQTMNAFIYYLPEINLKYGKYFAAGNKSDSMFEANESWVDFIQTYVFPKTEIQYGPDDSESKKSADKWKLGLEVAKNPVWSKLMHGDYIQDPTQLMSDDARNTVVAASNATNFHAGDDAVLEALEAELKSMTAVYDQLLNRIPVSELVKMAATLIYKCVASDKQKKSGMRNDTKRHATNSSQNSIVSVPKRKR